MRLTKLQEADPTCSDMVANIHAREEVQKWLEREEIM